MGIRYDGHQRLFYLQGHAPDPSHDAQGVQTAGYLGTYFSEYREQNPPHAV